MSKDLIATFVWFMGSCLEIAGSLSILCVWSVDLDKTIKGIMTAALMFGMSAAVFLSIVLLHLNH